MDSLARHDAIRKRVSQQLAMLANLTEQEILTEITDYCKSNRRVFIWAFDEDATGFYNDEDFDPDVDEPDTTLARIDTPMTQSLLDLCSWFDSTVRCLTRRRCEHGVWV